jgi:iron(III) transport system substrate-binding protein
MIFMQKKMRFIAILLSVFIVAALITACGQSTTAPAPEPKSSEGTSSSSNSPEPKGPATVEEIALYEGADRDQRLVEAAKEEGTLNLYTSMSLEDMDKITAEFEKKYGIKVVTWRAGSEKVVQRAITEAQAGRHDFDVVETNGPELEVLHREKLLQEVKSPYLSNLIPEAIMPHKEWVATRLNIFVQAYNTDKIKKEDLPKTWEDLLDPKYKGQLAVEAEDYDWFAGVIKELGEEKGTQLFKDIVATNGLSLRKGHTLLTKLVASGEVPFALTVYNYKAEQLKGKGAPLDWFAIEPAIARPNGVGVAKKASHPNAAVLFYDFMISDGQQILGEIDFVPTSTKVETTLNDMKLRFVDPAIILDEYDKWTGLWNEIIVNQK